MALREPRLAPLSGDRRRGPTTWTRSRGSSRSRSSSRGSGSSSRASSPSPTDIPASSRARTASIPRVGGYLFAVSLYEEFHVNKIATDPRIRNRGLGRMLLEDALARARRCGATAVTLEVRVSNIPAREFYRSYGFREAYRRKAYYQDGEDAFAMMLPLET